MALYFGYKKLKADTEEIEKDISALKTSLATNNTKTKSLEDSLFKKDGTVQMTGDLDLGDNSIIGVDDINANNSVVSKKYVDDNLSGKLSAPSNFVISKITFAGGISMGGSKIQYLDSPTSGQDATHKTYVDNKVAANTTKITSLETRATTLESKPKIYNYFFTYGNLGTTYTSPQSKYILPDYWMFCKGLTRASRFHLHHLIYDSDSNLDSNYTFTFQLDFFILLPIIILILFLQ